MCCNQKMWEAQEHSNQSLVTADTSLQQCVFPFAVYFRIRHLYLSVQSLVHFPEDWQKPTGIYYTTT